MSKQEILLTESAVDFLKEEIGGGSGIEYVELEFNSATSSTTVELTEEQLTKLQNGAFIKATNNLEEPETYTLVPIENGARYSSGIYHDVTVVEEALSFEYVQCSIIYPVEVGTPVTAVFHKFIAHDIFSQRW